MTGTERFIKCSQEHVDLEELKGIKPNFGKFLHDDLTCFQEAKSGQFIKAYWDDTLVGFIFFYELSDSCICRISYVYVASSYRGKGIGKRLVEKVVNECIWKGWTRIKLEISTACDPDNKEIILKLIEPQKHRIDFKVAGV